MTETPDSVTNGFRRLLCFMFLWNMKCAEKICVWLMIFLPAVSCGLDQLEETRHSNQEGVWMNPSFGKYSRDKCYALAFDYPDGYDWRSDPDKGTVRCSMVLFADGVPMLKIPVGERHQVSSDPGSYRLSEGHLYTFHADSISTTVRKDGHILYAWEGAEVIDDIRDVNGSIHTLSRPSGAGGFVYRVDGGTVVQRQTGRSFGHLDVLDGHVYFYFSQSVASSDSAAVSYYRVTDGKVMRIVPSAQENMTDIRMFGPDVMLSITGGQVQSPVMIWEDHKDTLGTSMVARTISASFLDCDRPVALVRHMYSGANLMTDIIWEGGKDWKMYRIGSTLAAVYADDSGYGAVINPKGIQDGTLFSGSKAYLIPSGYSAYSRDCMVRKKGVMHAGLTSVEGGFPVVWREGVLDTLKVNGPLVCLR